MTKEAEMPVTDEIELVGLLRVVCERASQSGKETPTLLQALLQPETDKHYYYYYHYYFFFSFFL